MRLFVGILLAVGAVVNAALWSTGGSAWNGWFIIVCAIAAIDQLYTWSIEES